MNPDNADPIRATQKNAEATTVSMAAVPQRIPPVAAKPIPPRLATLILLTALAVLPVNLILPSLPNIARSLDAEFALVSLSVAGYGIATAITEIFAGALSDRYGRRPVVLVSISIFIASSIGCALATDIRVFLIFRLLQASIAACFSVAMVIIKQSSGEGASASRMGAVSMGWATAPMLGPLVGGILDEAFGWRSCFVVFAILGSIVLAFALRDLRDTGAPGEPLRTTRRYLASYRLLVGSLRFWAYGVCLAASMATLYVFFAGAPIIAGKALGGSSARLGLLMGLVPAGFIFGSFLTGRFAARWGLGSTLVLGRFLTCCGLVVGLVLSLSGTTHILAVFTPMAFIGIGNGMTLPTANTAIMSVRADLAGTAAGLAAALSIGGGAVIASIASPFLTASATIPVLFVFLLIPASAALLAAIAAAIIDGRRAAA